MNKLIVFLIAIFINIYACAEDVSTLRPGDVLKLNLPGEIEFADTFQIKRDGSMFLPEIGQVGLAGMTLEKASSYLKKLLGEEYRAIGDFSLQLVERRLPIRVLGFVKSPGLIDLPADGNIQMALQEAGGPSAGAQLDRMQINRQGTVNAFDYKRYLDTGDFSILPKLQPLDVIFVPASPLIGNVQMEFDAATLSASGDGSEAATAVKVFGEVLKPGVFSYKSGNTVVDMLMRAGGVTRYAGVEHIRVINQGVPQLFDLKHYLDTGDAENMPVITAGSTLFVPIQEEEIKTGLRTVYVMGEVFKPGAYEAATGTAFFDILANAGGPTRFAETRQVRIIRTTGKVDAFDLQAYTEGLAVTNVPKISPGDAIFVPEKTDMNEKSWLKISPNRAIRVIGAVIKPGRYEWGDEMSFLDILAHAGGPTQDADISQIKVLKNGRKTREKPFDLAAFISDGGDFSLLPEVGAGDTIIVPEKPRDVIDNKARWLRQSQESSIYVFGQVGQPGRYAFDNKLHFLDILSAADGPTQYADIHTVKVTHRNGYSTKVSTVDLGLYFETGDESLLPLVRAGDTIYIPQRDKVWLDKKKEQTVRIIGAVDKPGRYTFSEEMTVLDLLAEAGGPTENAHLEKIMVVNISTASANENQSQVFDLEAFVERPDFNTLPLVRTGDTVFVPDISNSNWNVFISNVKDMVSIASLVVIAGGI
ncbi:sugar ABC transporter substrate-binding protein [Thalassotalea sp. M1531]|uniref:Sugar ABC transporter substrate-binding protein n=1 Tax=Thalassotalea algicola TaxID=2716224 RepID=A0A7Y0LCK7_9GAMM|nr:SLBB domain-containing protein [Thalassotalea algicola]NMP32100.1 sugar ABC transporter substrate-binding protein [Thalassotalea algicola]